MEFQFESQVEPVSEIKENKEQVLHICEAYITK